MAKFKYPAECVAHRCSGHPNKGPLYYLLGTASTVPAELNPALQTHLREHHGDLALLAPHGLATDPPQVLTPKVKPCIWFHDLPALATLRGTMAAVDAGATPAGMAMVGVAHSGLEAYRTHVASGVGTSQEGEAMILLSYIHKLAQQPRAFWLVPDSEAAVGALRTYQVGGHYGDGIHHLYATVLGGRRLSPASAINVVTTPSHWVTDLNVRVDAATREPLEVDLTWLLRRPFSFIPPGGLPGPVPALSDSAERLVAGSGLHTGYEARWEANYTSGSGLPPDWFDSDQQRHIAAHRMDNIPTMTVLAHRSTHRNTVLDTTCLLCGAQPETVTHLWAFSAQSHEWGPARRRLAEWLAQKVGKRAESVRHQLWEPAVMEQWAAASLTPPMQRADMECSGPHALGTEFIRHAIEESIRVWYAHAKARATLLKARLGPSSTMAWVLQGATPAPAGGERGSAAGTSGMTAVARRVTSRFPRLPLFPPITTHLHTAHALDTQPSRLPVPVGRHPGHCLLVTAPSAQHNTTQHSTAQHNTTQSTEYRAQSTEHRAQSTEHSTAQHNITQHNHQLPARNSCFSRMSWVTRQVFSGHQPRLVNDRHNTTTYRLSGQAKPHLLSFLLLKPVALHLLSPW